MRVASGVVIVVRIIFVTWETVKKITGEIKNTRLRVSIVENILIFDVISHDNISTAYLSLAYA